MNGEKCFCHFSGFAVKDATARNDAKEAKIKAEAAEKAATVAKESAATAAKNSESALSRNGGVMMGDLNMGTRDIYNATQVIANRLGCNLIDLESKVNGSTKPPEMFRAYGNDGALLLQKFPYKGDGYDYTNPEKVRIRNVAEPVNDDDAVTKKWVRNQILTGGGSGGSGSSSGVGNMVLDLDKYGITTADYAPPFTEEMFRTAYANGEGFNAAISDAKEIGAKEIVVPPGNYPLCYSATEKDQHNPIIRTNGVNLIGYGAKLYVIYDESGANPYYAWTEDELSANGGVQNHYILMGTVIQADANVEGFEIVGERAFRTANNNAKYRESSKGVAIDHWANCNTIKNCNIHHFSGDGIGGEILLENVYVSGALECPSGKMVNGVTEESDNSWLSPRMGVGINTDMNKPVHIASTGYNYFIWTKNPLSIHCFTIAEEYITTIRVTQGNPFVMPAGTHYVYVEMYSGGTLTSESVTTVSFRFGNMYYFGTTIENCDIYLNQRGGISNVPSGTIIRNCNIHQNGGAYGDMVAFYDSTQFGIDIEDWYIDAVTVEGCKFFGNKYDILFRCNGITVKNSVLQSEVKSLNYAVNVWFENSTFNGRFNFVTSAEFGRKCAVNCVAEYGFPDEVNVLGEQVAKAELDLDDTNVLVFKSSRGTPLFTADLAMLGKTYGETPVESKLLMDVDFTAASADNLAFDDKTGNVSVSVYSAAAVAENGVCLCEAYKNMAQCTWKNAQELHQEMAFEVLCFGVPNILWANNAHKRVLGSYTNVTGDFGQIEPKLPYTTTAGETAYTTGRTSRVVKLDDGTLVTANDDNIPGLNAAKYTHIVLNIFRDGTMKMYYNGYPVEAELLAADFAAWDFSSFASGFYFMRGQADTAAVIKTARWYNKALTKSEIRNNMKVEAKKLSV